MNRSTFARLAAVAALALSVLCASGCDRAKPGPGPKPISGQAPAPTTASQPPAR